MTAEFQPCIGLHHEAEPKKELLEQFFFLLSNKQTKPKKVFFVGITLTGSQIKQSGLCLLFLSMKAVLFELIDWVELIALGSVKNNFCTP